MIERCGVLLRCWTPTERLPPASREQSPVAADGGAGLAGYERDSVRHCVDGDGCHTRREVLLAEVVTKPEPGERCAITGKMRHWLRWHPDGVVAHAVAACGGVGASRTKGSVCDVPLPHASPAGQDR